MFPPPRPSLRERIASLTPLQKITIILSLGMFLISFALPTFCINGEPHQWASAPVLLLIGWMGILGGGAYSWMANPLFLAGWLFSIFDNKKAVLFSGLAAIVASAFMFTHSVMINEGSIMAPVTARRSGYYLWLSASVLLFVGNLLQWLLNRKKEK